MLSKIILRNNDFNDFCRGSLILRLNQLVRRYRSEANVWKYENKYMGGSKKSKVNLNALRIVHIRKEGARIVLHCCRDIIDSK